MGNAHSSMSTAPRGSDSHSVWNSALAACVEEANREHLTSLLAQAAASATDPQFQPSLAGVLGPLLRDRAPALPPPQVLVDSTLGSEPDCSLQQEEFEKKGVRPFVSSDSPKRKTKASRNPSPPAESTLGLLGTTNVSHGFSNKQRKSVIDGRREMSLLLPLAGAAASPILFVPLPIKLSCHLPLDPQGIRRQALCHQICPLFLWLPNAMSSMDTLLV